MILPGAKPASSDGEECAIEDIEDHRALENKLQSLYDSGKPNAVYAETADQRVLFRLNTVQKAGKVVGVIANLESSHMGPPTYYCRPGVAKRLGKAKRGYDLW